MRLTGLTLVVLLTIGQPALAASAMRLQGLDRLYFESVKTITPQVTGFLPEALRTTHFGPKGKLERKIDENTDVNVEDFALPVRGVQGELSLRQVIVGEETRRITELWWALYAHGQRSDVWYFTADPTRTESKALSNYEIEAAIASGGGVELRVRGMMFRPQGAWWITGKTFSFLMQDHALTLSHVRNDFGFSQDYDLGKAPPPIIVSTEREAGGRFESLTYNSVPDRVLHECGFQDPQLEDWSFRWTRMEKTALCITAKAGERTSYRGFDAPSFAERGGKSSE